MTSKTKQMQTALLIGLLALTIGCAAKQPIRALAPEQREACRWAGYCGPDSGKIVVGSTICYTNHLSEDVEMQDAAGKWYHNWPRDMKCVR